MRIASEGGLLDAGERIVVSPAFGTFSARRAEVVTSDGEWVTAGQVLGEVAASAARVEVRSPCRALLVAYLVTDGDRVRPGDALVHLRAL